MTFRELFIRLADTIGRQHLPVDDDANDINDFVGQDAVHHDLVRQLVRKVYRANRCGYLDAPVTTRTTLDALGEIQGNVLRNENSDFDQVSMLRDLGDAAAAALPRDNQDAELSAVPAGSVADATGATPGSGIVRRLPLDS